MFFLDLILQEEVTDKKIIFKYYKCLVYTHLT